ncbi:MAG: TOBE domain-containing protein [Acidimicrobiales bacterium]
MNPAEVYRRPATPFVAGFVGAMNSLAGTVSPTGGFVECLGMRLPPPSWADPGAAVTVLLRPESLSLAGTAGPGAGAGAGGGATVEGTVVSQSFLGAVTRLRVYSGGTELLADVASLQALSVGPGAAVTLRLDPAACHVVAPQNIG